MEIIILIAAILIGLFLLLVIGPIALMFLLAGSKMRLAEQISKRQMLFMQQVFRPDLNNQQVFRPEMSNPQMFQPDTDQMYDHDNRYR